MEVQEGIPSASIRKFRRIPRIGRRRLARCPLLEVFVLAQTLPSAPIEAGRARSLGFFFLAEEEVVASESAVHLLPGAFAVVLPNLMTPLP